MREELEELESSTFDVSHFKRQLEETEILLSRVERDIREGNNKVYEFSEQVDRIRSEVFSIKTVEIHEI